MHAQVAAAQGQVRGHPGGAAGGQVRQQGGDVVRMQAHLDLTAGAANRIDGFLHQVGQ